MSQGAYVCPDCGEESMVKKTDKPGWYRLHCQKCGAERGPFRDAEDKAVA